MKNYLLTLGCCFILFSLPVLGQTSAKPGMQTYSPYTPEQLKFFNDQPISPAEGPFGPVDPSKLVKKPKKSSFDSKYYQQPEGEEEAESLETESADPYQAITPTISF